MGSRRKMKPSQDGTMAELVKKRGQRNLISRQTEVDDDCDDETNGRLACTSPCGGVPTTTVQLASSSSDTSPDDSFTKQIPAIAQKKTLIRTAAFEGSPPPPEFFSNSLNKHNGLSSSMGHLLTNGTSEQCVTNKGSSLLSHNACKVTRDDSGLGTFDNNDAVSDKSEPSRGSSLENASMEEGYTDAHCANLPSFFKETIKMNSKNRTTVLEAEKTLLQFINDHSLTTFTTQQMNGYERMVVHRLSAFLGLLHNTIGSCVTVTKTDKTRVVKLTEQIIKEIGEPKKSKEMEAEEPKKTILLKKPASLDEKHGRHINKCYASQKSKSLEERQDHYIQVRERIFNENDGINSTPSHLSPDNIPQAQRNQTSRSWWTNQETNRFGKNKLLMGPSRAPMTKSHSYGGPVSSSPQPSLHLSQPMASLQKSETLKDSQTVHYAAPAYNCGLPALSSEHPHMSRTTPDSNPSPLSNQSNQYPTSYAYLVSSDYSSIPVGSIIINPQTMQPHLNSDGTIYRFDPHCPPPFVPPPSTTPVGNLVYHTFTDAVNDISTRMAVTAISPADAGAEAYSVGQHVVPAIMQPAPQPIYPGPHYNQSFIAAAGPAQSSLRYIPLGYNHQTSQQILPTPLESQGQATVPMPAVGLQAMAGTGGYQFIGAPYSNATVSAGPMPQGIDISSMYHYAGTAETSSSSAAAVPVNPPSGLIQAYNVAYPSQPMQLHPSSHNHQSQFNPSLATPPGTTYYTVSASTPASTQPLAQPPPSSHLHQQQHQSAVFYAPTNMAVGPINYTVPVSNPSQSSTSSYKNITAQYLANHHLRSSTTPPQQHHQLHQQTAPSVNLPSNGHQSAPLTLNYGQPINFAPGQTVPNGPGQLVAFQANPCQVRPVNTVFHVNTGVQQAQLPYQLYRPSEFKLVTQNALQRQSSLSNSQQPRMKGNNANRQNRRTQKKPESRDVQDFSAVQQHQAGGSQNLSHSIAPHIANQGYLPTPSSSSLRQ